MNMTRPITAPAPRRAPILRSGRIALLALMASAGLVLSGCNKMLANFSLNQADKRVAESRENQADVHTPDDLVAVDDLINQAKQSMQTEQFKEARGQAKIAATEAKRLLERTKTARSTFLKSEANRWINILDLNDGRVEDTTLYDQVLVLRAEGDELYGKQKWDDTIEAFSSAVNSSEFLLENLKRQSDEGLREIDQMKDRLIAEGSPEHYPEAIIEIDNFKVRIEDLVVNKLEYRTALVMRDQARQASDAGVLKTKEIKSEKLIRQIETLLTQAEDLGADRFAQLSLDNVNREFEQLLKQFFEQKFDTVLTTAPDVVPMAESLIVETHRESARDRIDAVTASIGNLVDGKAPIYLPGRVDQMQQLLAQAQTKFDAEAYEETKEIGRRALEEERRIIDAFDALAQREITQAQADLTVAESVFTTMEDIFAKSPPGSTTADEQSMEDMKSTLREELRAEMRTARLDLGLATIKKDDKVFFEAIETAKNVVASSGHIVQETWHVVAINSIQELQNQIEIYEREGGRQFAPSELERTEKLLAETRALVASADYREAALSAAETKAELQVMEEELARVAERTIQTAESAIQMAERYRATDFQGDTLEQARSLIGQSRSRTGVKQLREAIELGHQAAEVATLAGDESIRMWAEEELRSADLMLGRCRDSNATTYAAPAYEEALNLRRSAEELYQTGDMEQAQALAAEAYLVAQDALYANVIRAEDAIAMAKRVGGWEYEHERLAQAIVNAGWAKDSLDQGDFKGSEQQARMAITVAQNVSVDAANAGFRDQFKALEARVGDASTKGPGFYQPSELARLIGEMRALQTDYEPSGFEDARAKIEQLDAQLQGLVESTPEALGDLVDEINTRLANLESRGARGSTPALVADATDKIKYAQLDFQEELYRKSYRNSRDAVSLLNQIELRLDEGDFDRQLNLFFTEFSQILEDFGSVLNMGAPILMRLVEGTTAQGQAVSILNSNDPTEFRQQLADLALKVSFMEAPRTRVDVYEGAVNLFATAQEGARGFEKLLILDQFSQVEARKIISGAFLRVASARNQQEDLQRHLRIAVARAEEAPIRRVLQERP